MLDRVRAAGIPIVGATGRGPRLTELTRNDIRAADFLVLAGGGRVLDQTDPAGPVVLRDERLPGPCSPRLLAALEAEVGPLTVMVEALDEHDAPLWGDHDPAWRYPDRFEARPRADCLDRRRDQGVRPDARPRRRRAAGGRPRIVPPHVATVTQAGLGFIEICPPGRRQGHRPGGRRRTPLGVDPADVLVFGDMPNDLPMFAWAGLGPGGRRQRPPDGAGRRRRGHRRRNDDDGVAGLPRPATVAVMRDFAPGRHRPRRHPAPHRPDAQPAHRRRAGPDRCRGTPVVLVTGRPVRWLRQRVRPAARRRCRRSAPTAPWSTTRTPTSCCAPTRWTAELLAEVARRLRDDGAGRARSRSRSTDGREHAGTRPT